MLHVDEAATGKEVSLKDLESWNCETALWSSNEIDCFLVADVCLRLNFLLGTYSRPGRTHRIPARTQFIGPPSGHVRLAKHFPFVNGESSYTPTLSRLIFSVPQDIIATKG